MQKQRRNNVVVVFDVSLLLIAFERLVLCSFSSCRATGIMAEMRSTFGVNDCRLLCINSAIHGTEEHQENPWASYVRQILILGLCVVLLHALIYTSLSFRKIMLQVTSSWVASLVWMI